MPAPFASRSDPDLTEAQPITGRRSAPRLRLSIPARIETPFGAQRCVLVDVSRTGAQIGLEDPLAAGEGAYLIVGDLEAFAFVTRRIKNDIGGTNGLQFEEPIGDEAVLAIRRYSESFEEDQRRALRTQARAWVLGER